MNFREIEDFLTNLKSVMSCKIIVGNNNEIIEIHILADSSRNTKQICRDIQSVLISRFNIDIDYKKISIAQISDNLTINDDFRLKIKSVQNENNLSSVSVKVVLEFEDKIYEGLALGPKTERNIMKLSSIAALKAVEKAIGFEDCLLLEEIENKYFAGKEIVTSAINFIINGKETLLCGSAFVDYSKTEAAVKATLCAINRSVAKYSSTN